VRTPTLILHGEADDACPVQQAREWFAALRMRGVPSRMVVYPGADHLFIQDGSVAERADYQERLVQWLKLFTNLATASGAPAALPRDASYWQQRLNLLRQRHGVVGAQFGIVRLDGEGEPVERTVVSSGLRDTSRTDAVTDDTLFQIGSITKAWTTVLILQLVDEGRLTLETPVHDILPGFTLGDPDAAAAVTVRTLLTHTSGMEGDLITDTGPADDCVERYVASLRTARQLHPVGERFSYCNSGFVVAGRIIEVLRGMTWDEALRRHILEPLRLSRTFTLLEDAPRFTTANGHLGDGEQATPATQWRLPRSMGPAGLICANADDVLTFAQALLRDGVAPNGTRILSADSAIAMREVAVDLRDTQVTTSGWGLGMVLEDWGGSPVFGHDGATIGQRAYLRVLPDHAAAAILLTSGGRSDGLHRELFEDLASWLGVSMPSELHVGEESRPTPTGSYGYADAGAVVSDSDADSGSGGLLTVIQPAGATAEPTEERFDLYPSDAPGVWAWTSPELAGWVQFRPVEGGAYLGLRYLPARVPPDPDGLRSGAVRS
jgi:CubicO group peptidase (beta-lactamase class C family)